jgi:release factor glutamine methyltransferase
VSFAGLSRRAAQRRLAALLTQAGLDSAQDDARLLLLWAAGDLSALELALEADTLLEAEAAARLARAARQRIDGAPVSRIIGRRGFWDVEIEVRPDVLDPRPDSEAIIALAQRLFAARAPRNILDLGAGSGALLCAGLSAFPSAFGVAVDRAPAAVAAASANLVANNLGARSAVLRGDWASALSGSFDLIVSNPPYIARDALAGLPREVAAHDPVLALDGGTDGLDAYRALAPQTAARLEPQGWAIFEIGWNQEADVAAIGAANGLHYAAGERDLGGILRAMAFKKAV